MAARRTDVSPTRYPPSVVIAGPLCAGKTTLARGLESHGWRPVSARRVIAESVGASDLTRSELERVGRALETRQPGNWLASAAVRVGEPVVVDAVRTLAQLEATRDRLSNCLVVHLRASYGARRKRFEQRVARGECDDSVEFDAIALTALERDVGRLVALADLVLDTSAHDAREVVSCVLGAADDLL